MPPFILTILKLVFLALLYFFVYRVVRAVATDLRGTRAARVSGPSASAPGPRPAAKAKPPRSLVILDERGSKARSYRLDGNVQIGRADSCQIQLGDTYVSSQHARIFRREDAWFIEDLGSTNGTYLNQRRLTAPAELRAGDRVKMGKTVLELRR